jgi:hypothetical protein
MEKTRNQQQENTNKHKIPDDTLIIAFARLLPFLHVRIAPSPFSLFFSRNSILACAKFVPRNKHQQQ